MKKVSLKDIAEEAGVSTALVSYVLNGKEREARVGEAIAKKIREIAKSLNYQPNHLAKSLRSGKTHTLGLIIADISNPFFANIARVVEDQARHHGYTVIIGSCDEDASKSWDLLNVLVNRQVDGFIIVSCEGSENQVTYLKERNIPFVLLDRHFPALNCAYVATDNYKAAYDAGIHLLQSGYRNVGMIAYESAMHHMTERIGGYRASQSGSEMRHSDKWLRLVKPANVVTDVRLAVDSLIASSDKIDALIFATYSLAINGLKYFNELKLKVPSDVAIVSFGQAEAFDLYYCPITYVHQPLEMLGQTAVAYLLEQLAFSAVEPRQMLMEANLVIRESSARKGTRI